MKDNSQEALNNFIRGASEVYKKEMKRFRNRAILVTTGVILLILVVGILIGKFLL